MWKRKKNSSLYQLGAEQSPTFVCSNGRSRVAPREHLLQKVRAILIHVDFTAQRALNRIKSTSVSHRRILSKYSSVWLYLKITFFAELRVAIPENKKKYLPFQKKLLRESQNAK